jgi:hypothetical protein
VAGNETAPASEDGLFARQAPQSENQQVIPNDNSYPVDLKVISQPPGSSLSDLSTYAYNTENSQQVVVYVVDSGANTDDPVSLQNLILRFIIN